MFAWSFQSSSILASEGVLASIHLPAFIHSTCCLCFCLFVYFLFVNVDLPLIDNVDKHFSRPPFKAKANKLL